MSESEFLNQLKILNVDLSEEQVAMLRGFANILLDYNTRVNLTAIRNLEDVYLKHFYDSLTLVKAYKFTNETVLDVGTGPGFPGMVLKIAFPNIKITLLDSNGKKVKFLNYVVEKMNLRDVTVVCDRAEEFFKQESRFDVVVSRAVADLNILTELCIPFCRVGGRFVAMKGKCDEELDSVKSVITFLGADIDNIIKFELPKDAGERCLINIKKIQVTKDGYPRSYDKILKCPLAKMLKIK